jgi:predicted RNase H-like HicB family nuclease
MTAIIELEDDGFTSLCPELDIASQGATIEEARANLIEALTLFFETASESEVARRFQNEVFVLAKSVAQACRVETHLHACQITTSCGFLLIPQAAYHR